MDQLYHDPPDSRRPRGLVRSLVTSRTMQKAVIGTTLVVLAATLLYVPAVFGYFYFYYKYLPDQVTTVPVHLQYGFGPNPFGIASLAPPAQLRDRQPYDITVSLTLPRSPTNLDRGNFMIALHLLSPSPSAPNTQTQLPYITPTPAPALDANPLASLDLALQPTRLDMPAFLAAHTILHTSTRPAIIPYVDPLASSVSRVLLLLYHLLFPRTAGTVHLAVPMAEQLALTFPSSTSPGSLLLEVQAGQGIQVYEASVTFTAKLRGLRWFMYRWRGTAFVLLSGGFWLAEVGVMMVFALVIGLLSGWRPGTGGKGREDEWLDEGGSGDGDGGSGDGFEGRKIMSGDEWLAMADVSSSPSSVKREEGSSAKREERSSVKREEGEGSVRAKMSGAGGNAKGKRAESEAKRPTKAEEERQGEEEGHGEEEGQWQEVKKKKKKVKKEEEQEALSKLPGFGAEQSSEADEGDYEAEDEAGNGSKDSGVGTSYSGGASKKGARKRNVSGRRSSH